MPTIKLSAGALLLHQVHVRTMCVHGNVIPRSATLLDPKPSHLHMRDHYSSVRTPAPTVSLATKRDGYIDATYIRRSKWPTRNTARRKRAGSPLASNDRPHDAIWRRHKPSATFQKEIIRGRQKWLQVFRICDSDARRTSHTISQTTTKEKKTSFVRAGGETVRASLGKRKTENVCRHDRLFWRRLQTQSLRARWPTLESFI